MAKRKRGKRFVAWVKKNGVIAASVTILLSVDLALNMVSMAIISTGELERVGFVAIGIVIVALGVPSYFRGFKGLWLTFAILSAFLNTSFTLESTRIQSLTTSIETDTELIRLTTKQDEAEESLRNLRQQYQQAGKRETMDQLATDIAKQVTAVDDAKLARNDRFRLVEFGGDHPPMLGKDVFTAIPTAVGIHIPASWIELPFFACLFFGMQRAIVIFATNRRKQPRTEAKKEDRAQEQFDDITDAEYIEAAKLKDGAVKAPEDIASDLGISLDQSYRKHTALFSGWAYRDGKYVRKI